jgi:folate-binding protein YgfZ
MQQKIEQWLVANQGSISDDHQLTMPEYVAQLAAVTAGQAYSLLSKFSLLAIHGEDAAAFLQGQFSCDVAAIAQGGVTLGSYSTAKGRMQASFVLAAQGGIFYLLLRRDIAEAFRRRLGMFVLRAKVKIEDVTAQYGLWLAQDASADAPALRSATAGSVVCALGGGIVLHLVAEAAAEEMGWVQGRQPVGSAAADLVFIRAGLGWVSLATFEEFVPQMLNLELLGGINFKKGCYPGQEIVARTQYLGKIKRRLYRACVHGALVKEGDAILAADTGDQVIGRVVLASELPQGDTECLLVIQTAAWGAQPKLQNDPAAVIEKLALPYSVPDAD